MLPTALSPCPNDTYLFWAWIHGFAGSSLPITPCYADIDTLNKWAYERAFPLMKVSINMFGSIRDDYILLPVGTTLGYGVGPKIISRTPKPDLSKCRIAIPGHKTSAHLLFDLFFKAKEKIFCTYDAIIPLLHAEAIDLGLIIHETRFTFQDEGFYEIADLGALWYQKFSLPLPLGGIVMRKDQKCAQEICSILQDSFHCAKNHSEEMYSFILSHSREKSREIVQKHIDLYVTQETWQLSSKGHEAIEKFLMCGKELGYHDS